MNEVRQVNQIDCIDSYLKLIDLRSSAWKSTSLCVSPSVESISIVEICWDAAVRFCWSPNIYIRHDKASENAKIMFSFWSSFVAHNVAFWLSAKALSWFRFVTWCWRYVNILSILSWVPLVRAFNVGDPVFDWRCASLSCFDVGVGES